jgi:hypothetical protein
MKRFLQKTLDRFTRLAKEVGGRGLAWFPNGKGFLRAAAISVTSVNYLTTGFVTGLLERANRLLELAKTFFIAGGQNLPEHMGDVLE